MMATLDEAGPDTTVRKIHNTPHPVNYRLAELYAAVGVSVQDSKRLSR